VKVLGDYAHRVHLSQEMALVLQNSISAARWHPHVDFGPPAKAAAVLERTVKLLAVLSGHMFTTPDHLLLGACDTLGHQLELLDDIWEGDEGGRCFRYYRYARLIVHDVVEQCCAVATD
jgi:MoxR-like ATPase